MSESLQSQSMAQPSVDYLLSCESITKSYGGVQALRGVDFTLVPGEVHGLVGPNGAGKSTLVKVIAGAVVPSDGHIRIGGKPATYRDPRQAADEGIILVPQELTTIPSMTVTENITLGSEPTRFGLRDIRKARERANAAMSAIGLDIDPDVDVGSLSPTLQRLVMIANAFDRQVRIVILDEPTAGLPPHEASLVLDAVDRLRGTNVAIIYVSHHLSEVARVCDRVTCVREGRNAGSLTGEHLNKATLVELIHDATGAVTPPTKMKQNLASLSSVADTGCVIELKNVTTDELAGISVEISATGVTGVAGLLGSGAKDLAAVLAGVTEHRSGTVIVRGETVAPMTPVDALDRGISYLAGDRSRSALRGSTIRENVSLSALRAWSRNGFIRRKLESHNVRTLLDTLGVKASAGRDIGELSGGNQQRVLVGRCLASEAVLIVLDEPTIGVDVASREELWGAVRTMAQSRAVVVASSDPEELVALCSTVICVANGSVVKVLNSDRITEARITSAIS